MEKRLSIIILLVPFFLFWHWFEPAAKKNRDGIKAYQEKNFDAALNHFLSAKGVKPDSAELKSNMAAALYRKEKYKEALDEFKNIDPEKTGIPASDFYYNMANTCFKQNQFKDALEFYKKSMLADSTDVDAKKNFELTLKKMEEQKKKDKKDKDKKDKNKDKKDKDKKKDQQKQDQKKDKKDKKEQQQQQQEKKKKEDKHKQLMNYLNQNEKKEMKKKKRKIGVVRKEKDW